LNQFLDFQSDLAKIDFEIFQNVRSYTTTLFNQAQQDVFSADVLVVESLGLLIGQLHDFASSVGKSFVHLVSLMPGNKAQLLSSRVLTQTD
jgi:hypothetical protein